MKPILQNLVEMTGHRDHLRLEVSVLSTLQKLSATTEVRALEVFTDDGATHVRPRTWVQDGDLVSTDSEAASDPQREPLHNYPALRQCIEKHDIRASASMRKGHHTLWLPVWMHDKVSTCLEITQSRPFSAHKLDVLMGVFQVYQNYQSLLDYSERDALTGLFNRKTFDEQFSRYTMNGLATRSGTVTDTLVAEESAAASDNEPVQQWLAVVDIDHFKQVNDRFGHLAGDRVLRDVAHILRSAVRSRDCVIRWGGEEFLVLLEHCEQAPGVLLAERIRHRVEAHHDADVGKVTLSLGLATLKPDETMEQLIARADEALYEAKHGGRNRLSISQRQGDSPQSISSPTG